MKIDTKSLVVGVLLTIVVFIALGAAQSTPAHPCGRYQIEATDNNLAYVIDTTTGQVWSKTSPDRAFYKAKNVPEQGNN